MKASGMSFDLSIDEVFMRFILFAFVFLFQNILFAVVLRAGNHTRIDPQRFAPNRAVTELGYRLTELAAIKENRNEVNSGSVTFNSKLDQKIEYTIQYQSKTVEGSKKQIIIHLDGNPNGATERIHFSNAVTSKIQADLAATGLGSLYQSHDGTGVVFYVEAGPKSEVIEKLVLLNISKILHEAL